MHEKRHQNHTRRETGGHLHLIGGELRGQAGKRRYRCGTRNLKKKLEFKREKQTNKQTTNKQQRAFNNFQSSTTNTGQVRRKPALRCSPRLTSPHLTSTRLQTGLASSPSYRIIAHTRRATLCFDNAQKKRVLRTTYSRGTPLCQNARTHVPESSGVEGPVMSEPPRHFIPLEI